MVSSLDGGCRAARAAAAESDESWEEISDESDDVEALRRRLQLEREHARAMEKRAVEAEEVVAWLKGELDQRSGSSAAQAQRSAQQDSDIREVLPLREELHKLTTHVAKKQAEVLGLKERSQEVSEQLERERQRVLDLEREESDNRNELDGIDDALRLNQQLQDELKYLRGEAKRLREKLGSSRGQEQNLRHEIEELQRSRSGSVGPDDQEMERLSMTVGGQLVSVERELATKTKAVSDLSEPFVREMRDLLEAARRACQRLDGDPSRTAPELFDARPRDLRGALRGMLELLRYMVEVLSREPRADGDGSDWSGSSRESVKPSRTVPDGDDRARSSVPGRPQQEEKSWGLSKRWTCSLDT